MKTDKLSQKEIQDILTCSSISNTECGDLTCTGGSGSCKDGCKESCQSSQKSPECTGSCVPGCSEGCQPSCYSSKK